MNLSELKTGQRAVILSVGGSGMFRKRILEMGFVRGKVVTAVLSAPLKDPVYYRLLNYNVSLRQEDARRIEVELLAPGAQPVDLCDSLPIDDLLRIRQAESSRYHSSSSSSPLVGIGKKHIRVALLGNPNCGKTSLFNRASGAHEHVGNYSGVTVEAHTGYFNHNGYKIEIVDLPGTYSLSPYSPEELYIREYLTGSNRPDIVLNVVDSTNLERNLYLTLQIKEIGLPVVMALNMYDELEKRQDKLDDRKLSVLLGIPMVPTVCRSGKGIPYLFDKIIDTFCGRDPIEQPITINYGNIVEPQIESLSHKLAEHFPDMPVEVLPRYVAVRLLEKDSHTEAYIRKHSPKAEFIFSARNYALSQIDNLSHGETAETLITDSRYGFITGALKETYQPSRKILKTLSEKVDHWMTHRFWGFPIFLLIMFIMFEATFVLGKYPMDWIEMGVRSLADLIGAYMAEGSLKDMLLDGVIGGVGGVIVFLPNILILYFFISLMEDSGYMSRAAFIMDKLMHKMGLHGKSFIPLVMGFGCNVPAIMATRTIESPKSRMITMLVLPLMSCSARLPVYLLIAGAFFPHSAGAVLFVIYLLGIILAVLSARLFKKTLFGGEDMPFVMELPPYRIPTWRSVLIHMWDRGKQYLRKMGGIILVASIVIWFLGYFPRNNYDDPTIQKEIAEVATSLKKEAAKDIHNHSEAVESTVVRDSLPLEKIFTAQENRAFEERAGHIVQQENSFIGRIGQFIEPTIKPLGFDWKIGVALLSGAAAKEIVVSTLGIIYTGDGSQAAEASLTEKLRTETNSLGEPSFTPLVAWSLMVFVLIYFPCIAVIAAIGKESGSWKWALFTIVYSCTLAWIMAFVVYQIGTLL